MYSVEKCASRAETGAADECEMYAGGGEAMGPEGVASDEVSSAVAATSNDIEEMLFREELADARADGIGADLADLSAELGLLAGLADGEAPPDFTSRFEVPFEWIGLSERAESESSSSWSGGRCSRRPPRPQRVARRRPPIAKGKDLSRLRSAALRRAASVRARRAELVSDEPGSDASDVGADSDSEDQWTELDDGQSGSSDNSSEIAAAAVACNGYQHKAECGVRWCLQPEPGAGSGPELGSGMEQLLLPLLSEAGDTTDQRQLLVRHEDILQLLASAEDIPLHGGELMTADVASSDEATGAEGEDDPITTEDEAAMLRYVCAFQSERPADTEAAPDSFEPLEEWLLGVYHSWCEISALMYTLIGTNMSEELIDEEWVYRARFGCHCRLCLSLAAGADTVRCLLHRLVTALAHGEGTSLEACAVVRALRLDGGELEPGQWDVRRVRRVAFSRQGAAIIHAELCRLAAQNETAQQIVNTVCVCKPMQCANDKQNAVERFCRILENFKAASIINFKVAMIPVPKQQQEQQQAGASSWSANCAARLERALAPHQRCSTAARLRSMRGRTHPTDLSAWSGYKHRCDCLTPRTLSAQQRKQLLRISFFGMMQAVNDQSGAAGLVPRPEPAAAAGEPAPTGPHAAGKTVEPSSKHSDISDATKSLEDSFQQLDVSGKETVLADPDAANDAEGKDPDVERAECGDDKDDARGNDDVGSDEWRATSTESSSCAGGARSRSRSHAPSLSCSSLDSASELLLAAAAAVDNGEDEQQAPQELCRTVRHLMRSIASIERLMDKVLKHCDQWLVVEPSADHEARKRVDVGLSEVDRKLMAMYRRLPEVHRRQLQVYRKQKKLSTVCMQLVGGSAPLPPPPGSPPRAPPAPPAAALCPDYHLLRFREVRRKVMHMRDQQLYYHRLRMWLEDQLNQERDSVTESATLDEGPTRRAGSPKARGGPKRRARAGGRPQRLLQLLRHKAPANAVRMLAELKDETSAEVEPPEAFPIDNEDASDLSETDTIVGERDLDMCKDMKECLAKFASFALNDEQKDGAEVKYPESVSPPLQEMSPTAETEPMPVYTPQPSQRLLAVNKLLNRTEDQKPKLIMPEVLNISVPLNARRTPVLVTEENPKEIIERIDKIDTENVLYEALADKIEEKDPNIYKYVTFGMEIKKAMEECQNIINSYNSINEKEKDEGQLSLEQICEVMMSLDKNSAEFLDKMDSNEPIDESASTKLAELVENMPQILANMPEIASKLSEFANASFELPEFASIMNSLPDVSNEAQLTPETLKQIRELKLSKNRDNIKVTKNTAKRKSSRRIKNNVDDEEFIELDSKEICELLKDDKEIQAFMKSKANNKENFKDLLFSLSAQVVINKVFEYLKQNRSPELSKCLEEEKDLLSFPIDGANSDMYTKASTLFDNSVKDALTMAELRELVRSRFNSWKHYVATKFKSIPIEMLENEIEAMLDKFYSYIQDLSAKHSAEKDKLIEKIEAVRVEKEVEDENESDGETCPSRESLKQITKLLSTSAGNTFDLLIMKVSKLSQDKKSSVKGLKFKYMDVIRRCSESQQLTGWIILNPEIAANVIQELTGLPTKKTESTTVTTAMTTNDAKVDYFLGRLSEMNRQYLEGIPKEALTGDEWLVMLYRMEQLEVQLKEALTKAISTPKNQNQASEAEILAAKGLSKIIGKANRTNKKPNETPKKNEEKPKEFKNEVKDEKEEKRAKNELLLAKCEAILLTKGDKALLENFYAIKSYISQGLPVPESYKKHVVSICSSIDAKLIDEGLDDIDLDIDTFKSSMREQQDLDKDKNLSVIGSQNPELLAKYSAQALRNAQQTLNAVTFRNIFKNGQSKSESEACDTPKSECKWTNDCICNQCKGCKENEGPVCLDMKQCDIETKGKTGLEDKMLKEQANKQAKPQAKPLNKAQTKCENQHVCKVGHTPSGGSCAGDGGNDQPCTCCYCTVFGHAPPLTTPVPRNFNETRERLRSILNKKKQKCRPNGGVEGVGAAVERRPVAQLQPLQCELRGRAPATPAGPAPAAQAARAPLPPQPPALPQTLPPRLPTPRDPSQPPGMALGRPQPQPQPAATKPPIVVPPGTVVRTDGKVNANAMEQIRIQQRKLQQQAQLQSQLQQQQQIQHQQHLQQQQKQQQQHNQQQKPEPIYDLPIHNKPQLTAEQQQQVRLRQQQLQQQQLQQQQLQQQQQQLLQQQQLQQQRASRPQQQRDESLSSRDSSVFSTSSGESGWRGSRPEDPRDLDALLQYIEGPARHVDRGKKKAKKQRQKAKKMEQRLEEEKAELSAELEQMKQEMAAMRATHAAAKRRVEEVRKGLSVQQKTKKKGKKSKLSGAQQAKVQEMGEQLEELTALLNAAAKEVQESEKQVNECSRRLQQCERELVEARAMLGKTERTPSEQVLHSQAALHQQKLQQQQLLQQRQQQQQLMLQQQRQLQARAEEARVKQAAILNATSASPIVRVRRAAVPGDPPLITPQLLQTNINTNAGVTIAAVGPAPPSARKPAPSWEQALQQINQLAKGGGKEKKKQKESKPEPKPKETRSQSLPETTQALSKKQRKALAKQQAEEEEKRKQELLAKQEAKTKKEAKKAESKAEKKAEKKAEAKKPEPAKKKEDKKETKDKQEKKGKENKQEKSAPPPKAKQPSQQNQQPTKKDKKKDATSAPSLTQRPASVSASDQRRSEGGAACSIMEQLSCGVNVADLRLPPGITLTRVQPSEKKEPPAIKSVPLWKSSQLAAAPTPVARPVPVINADPSCMAFSTAQPEPPKPIIIPEPQPQAPKSKKAKKKAKKAATEDPKNDGTKMVTLRNPMFHPNLPPVQISSANTTTNNSNAQKKQEIRIPDPIPMPPNACQATITPTSNGMYTIRNPLMSMMHQQTLMGMPPQPPVYAQPQYNYVNPNVYVPQTPQNYVLEQSQPANQNPATNLNVNVNVNVNPNPPKDEFQSRIMNLASFTQKNDEGYSLFSSSEDQMNQQRNFLAPEYYENPSPKPTVSPNPIGTRPNESRTYDDSSLFANPIQRPEPIGTPLKREDERSDYSSLYTPFGHGQEDRNVFRSALFSERSEARCEEEPSDPMPYFQRLRVGAHLTSEVSVHHAARTKLYHQESSASPDGSLFSCGAWPESNGGQGGARGEEGYGPVGARHRANESSVFIPDRTITNLSTLEVSEREIESFKRFDFYFDPPRNKPKVQLDVRDIANAIKHNQK